jgi:two-component system, LytTR family, sensor kinase
MKKRLYRTAIISAPILAILVSAPIYIVEKRSIFFMLSIWSFLIFFIFILWSINIAITSIIKNPEGYKRYFLSYFFVFLLQVFNVYFFSDLITKPEHYNILAPFVVAFSMNTIIIILSNSIKFQFQKESAELENEHLKVGNLEAQKQMLLQQLQPHFLFNALSTLKSLISENPNNAEDYVVKLSDFLRYSVQAKNNEIVSLDSELKFTKDYIDLQKVRFGEALQFIIDIEESYLSKKVPVYAIQTLVENAIKHNSFTDKKPLCIYLNIETNRIRVQNNKVSKTLVLPSGTGLENLNLRYKMIANTEIEINESNKSFAVLINFL